MKTFKKWLSVLVAAMMLLQPLAMQTAGAAAEDVEAPAAYGPVPSATQLQYHEEELSAFIHYGPNTYTGQEWGNGQEDPNVFNPTGLDTDQWVKTLKDAGFKRIIMIGRHHDGFCLWESDATTHDVGSSTNFQQTQAARGQSGDVFLELSKSCTKYDMDMGLYLSPWDANNPSYGYGSGHDDATDTNGDYNEYYMNQLKEVLGNPKYGNNGKFVEVWMDGAKGNGAAAQQYKFQEWFDLIEELQPGAVVFSPYGSTIRWIGNESGKAGDPCWSKLDQTRQRNWYDTHGGDEASYLNAGDPNGDIWSVGECDVSLTSGWFWKAGKQPKNMEELTDIYFKSVGRGQPLLLNVPPDTTGVLPQNFVDRVSELGETIRSTFRTDLTNKDGVSASATAVRGNSAKFAAANVLDDNPDTYWTMDDGQTTGSITIDLGGTQLFDLVSIEEYIKLGQRISDFTVEAHTSTGWKDFGSGHTIGAKRLVRGNPVHADQIRINITGSYAVPLIENVGVFKAEGAFEQENPLPEGLDLIDDRAFSRSGTWHEETIAGLNDTGIWADPGAEASFTFTGTKAWIIGTKDPGHGVMDVYIDGTKVASPNAYQANRQLKQVLYETDTLPYGEHTVRMVCINKATGLDAALVLANKGAGMFEIEPKTYTVNEGATTEITIKRVGGTAGSVSVDFETSPDTAVHGRHYNDVSKTVTFADGQDSATVTVEAIENNELTGDLRFFGDIVNPADGAILGFNTRAEITIKDNDSDIVKELRAALSAAGGKNEGLFTAASWTGFAVAKQAAQEALDRAEATEEQLRTALTNLQAAQEALVARTAYTADDPFAFPKENDGTKLAEAEFFTLVPISGDKYVRVQSDASASNGKKVSWMEPGNVIKLAYNAPKAGTYTVNCRYQSGRLDADTANAINWSGNHITSGSVRVFGDASAPYKNIAFDLEITQSGPGELVITADSNAAPNLDKFEITAKELISNYYTIMATAGENGTIAPASAVEVEEGENQAFAITPDRGYEVADVLVDGASVGAVKAYTFEAVNADHTIDATFRAMNYYGENNPVVLNGDTAPVNVEAEALEFGGGAVVEEKASANGGKLVGWLGNCGAHGNAWLNLWLDVPQDAEYDVSFRYFSGANDDLYYENLDQSISSSIPCEQTNPDFGTKTIRVALKKGVDRIKFFNDLKSTANLDSFTITKVQVEEPITVVSVVHPEAQMVEYGTAFEELHLPETVEAALSNESTATASVTWDSNAYDPETVGTQRITGVLQFADEAITNPENVKAEVSVTVRPKGEQTAHVLNLQYGVNANLKVEGDTKVIIERDGLYGAKVMAGETLHFTFKPVGSRFSSAELNGEAIDFDPDGFTYDYVMPNESAILRFTFSRVDKSILEAVLEVANEVTDEELNELIFSVREQFIDAREQAQKIYKDPAATEEQVDKAWKDLIDAMHLLSFKEGDKTVLDSLVQIAELIDLEKFTPKSQEGFAEALTAAQEICDSDEALEQDVKEAYDTLYEVIINLEFKADMASLQTLIDQADEMDLKGYLDGDEKDAFEEAYAAAVEVLANENAAQKQVDDAASALFEAMADLRKVPNKSALKALLDKYADVKPDGYNASLYAAFQAAMQVADEAYNDPYATPEQIAAACNGVETTYAILTKPHDKPSGGPSGGSRPSGGQTGGEGTAVVGAVPVVAAAQNVIAQPSVRSDTTLPFVLKKGSAYCFKMTVLNGSTAAPSFTVGNGNVLKTQFVAKIGNDCYYRIWAVGAPGQSTGVYTQMPNEAPQKHCVVTIA
ncbi:alpha-L-fucosidase [Anaeromassilibacillus senegalensis]|uniref:alpha-L-fucosidase n=1 Tax=Anaeromassilibacillus senegalensis TaxID=1673717 RepID=UPI0006831C9D|nr:alpha-L-fucosidase [Anaeromassilibacillus senegalensis]